MADLISRQALLEDIAKVSRGAGFFSPIYEGFANIVNQQPTVDTVPRGAYQQVIWERDLAIQQLRDDYGVDLGEKRPVDAVHVVRCKDCKYISTCGRPPFKVYCCGNCKGLAYSLELDDFCSYGEKREDNQD